MSQTTPEPLPPLPTPGGSTGSWATMLNVYLTELTALVRTLEDAVAAVGGVHDSGPVVIKDSTVFRRVGNVVTMSGVLVTSGQPMVDVIPFGMRPQGFVYLPGTELSTGATYAVIYPTADPESTTPATFYPPAAGACIFNATWVTDEPERDVYEPPVEPPFTNFEVLARVEDLPYVQDQAGVGRKMRLTTPMVTREGQKRLHVGFGDWTENSGPVRPVWINPGGYGSSNVVFNAEEWTHGRVAPDGSLRVPNVDPRGSSRAYLFSDAGGTWHEVEGTNPAGLEDMVHVFDCAVLGDGTEVIVGRRKLTADEKAASGFDPNSDACAGCGWESADGGATWVEKFAEWSPDGPSGYVACYGLGTIGNHVWGSQILGEPAHWYRNPSSGEWSRLVPQDQSVFSTGYPPIIGNQTGTPGAGQNSFYTAERGTSYGVNWFYLQSGRLTLQQNGYPDVGTTTAPLSWDDYPGGYPGPVGLVDYQGEPALIMGNELCQKLDWIEHGTADLTVQTDPENGDVYLSDGRKVYRLTRAAYSSISQGVGG